MATVKVTRNGRPVSGVEIKTESTFGFHNYDQTSQTNGRGEADLDDNANRFRIYADGREVKLVERLRGTIEVSL